MRYIIPISLMLLTLMWGCQKTLSQGQIESDIFAAISQGRPAQHIETILRQADDPVQAANHGIWSVMYLRHLPQDIEKNWQYYQPKATSQTPSIEIAEIINRYKITVLDVLVRHGGNLNRKSENGLPVIRVDAFSEITPNLLRWLLEHGYDANLTYKGNSDRTALSHCARPNQGMLRYDQKHEMIKMLLEHGANPNVKSLGQPILRTVVMYHKDDPYVLEIAKLLIKAGVDLQIKDRSGDTALVTALGMRRKDMALLLLEHTETIDTTNQFGVPIINLAAAYDHPKCIEMLIARGADVNTVNKRGYTPLHAAAADRNEEIIAILLEVGAAVNPVNDKSQTPLDITMVKDNCPPDETQTNKVINLLTRHGAKRAAELKETNTPTVY